jgi:hypothetical protein
MEEIMNHSKAFETLLTRSFDILQRNPTIDITDSYYDTRHADLIAAMISCAPQKNHPADQQEVVLRCVPELTSEEWRGINTTRTMGMYRRRSARGNWFATVDMSRDGEVSLVNHTEEFKALFQMSIDACLMNEGMDWDNPMAIRTKSIATLLRAVHVDEVGLQERALKYLHGLTHDEWFNIKVTMLGNVQLLHDETDKWHCIDWVRHLDSLRVA